MRSTRRFATLSTLATAALTLVVAATAYGSAGGPSPRRRLGSRRRHRRGGVARAAKAAKPTKLESAKVFVLNNQKDKDAQVVIEAKSAVALESLQVTATNGRRVLAVTSHDFADLGLSTFRTETPEPSLCALFKACPASVYTFKAGTLTGKTLVSRARLGARILTADATNVAVKDTIGSSQPVADAPGYAVEVENEATNTAVLVDLPATATSFVFPAELMTPNTPYAFDVGAIGANGNVAINEVAPTTGN